MPKYVYVQRGSEEGAKAMGLKPIDGMIEVKRFPEAFRQLEPTLVVGPYRQHPFVDHK